MPNEPSSTLPEGAFDGRQRFADLLRAAFDAAAQQQWREIAIGDADFADWPLGERAVLEALQAWAGPGRRLRMLAGDFASVERMHARFVPWRRLWDHIVECRRCEGVGAPAVPSLLWTPGWCLHRVDPVACRGVCGTQAMARTALRQRFDEAWQQGRPAFSASVLGL